MSRTRDANRRDEAVPLAATTRAFTKQTARRSHMDISLDERLRAAAPRRPAETASSRRE